MPKVLVLGAYGLIGSSCVAAISKHDVEIVGVGRSSAIAHRTHPEIDWIITDITGLSAKDWKEHLKGVDVVVNAAGALQDGARDSLTAIHQTSIENLCTAAECTPLRLVQISAAGASPTAPTEFFRSKARGDARIQASNLDWVILRPTLVVGPNAYGGTALLRGVAGFPWVGARVFEDSAIQTIGLHELADAVVDCASGAMPMRRIYDLTEAESRTFSETVSLVRGWLGFAPFILRIPIPRLALRLTALIADGLGWLGWRSAFRTTAMRTIANGVTGDATAWRAAGGRAFSALPQTLSNIPATLQERWFARLYLMLPISIAILFLFWLVSGIIGFWRFDAAVRIMTDRGFDGSFAKLAVFSGSAADIALGAFILYRPWAKPACLGMIALALGYMLGATLFAADLWADPLGPVVKVLPSIGLALLTYAMLEER
ncbi:MAG: SDR family oxidoreductase [Paracoccaceae bacterium]